MKLKNYIFLNGAQRGAHKYFQMSKIIKIIIL